MNLSRAHNESKKAFLSHTQTPFSIVAILVNRIRLLLLCCLVMVAINDIEITPE